MVLQSSKIHLSKEEAAWIAALHQTAERCRRLGYRDMAWEYTASATAIVNRATLKALTSGNCTNDLLMFGELPASYEQVQANRGKKDIHLKLVLIEGSPLAREIEAVLEKHMNEGENHE